jgi:hypothetical protein
MIGAIVVGDGVGTELAGVVPGTATDTTGGASTADVSTSVVKDGTFNLSMIWVAGAALALAAVGGAFAIASRNRRKGAVVG